MLTTLEYVTDGVIFDSQQDPHQPARFSDHRFIAAAQGTHLEDHRPPGGSADDPRECCGLTGLPGNPADRGLDFAACPCGRRSSCATAMAGRSATCASPSPIAATSAASTACRPRGCPGSTGPRSSRSRRSSASSALFASMGVSDVRLTGGEPLVRREFPRLVEMLGRDRGRSRPLADHQRLPARGHGGRARRGRPAAHQRLARLALAGPVLPDDAPRRAAAGAGRPRGARAPSRRSARSR